MRFSTLLPIAASLAVLFPSLASAQASADAAPKKPAKPVVAVLGASVSAGFVDPRARPDGERNQSIKLKAVLGAIWARGDVKMRDLSELATFRDPEGIQTKKVKRALGYKPDLVLGIDFMFWFGYGHSMGRSPEDRAKRRLAEQQIAFRLIEKFDCPVILGDYPDMHGADPMMLSASQIPSLETLKTLNQRLHAFADKHDKVHVFPLSTFVAEAKTKGLSIDCDGETFKVPPMALLQSDRLHSTRLGMSLVGQRLASALLDVLPAKHPLRPSVKKGETIRMAPFVDKAQADAELDLYR